MILLSEFGLLYLCLHHDHVRSKCLQNGCFRKKLLYSKELSFLEQSSDLITLAEGQERGWVCISLEQISNLETTLQIAGHVPGAKGFR